MEKKREIIVLIIILIVSSSLLLLFNRISKVGEEKSNIVEETKEELNVECANNAEFRDKSACLDTELNLIAHEELDIDYCDHISNSIIREECKIDVVAREVFEKDDPEICEKLADSEECKKNYYLEKIFRTHDTSFLEMIDDEDVRNEVSDSLNFEKATITKDCSILKTQLFRDECKKMYESDGEENEN